VLDFGSQYSQLIARRVRELHVYSRIVSWKTPAEEIRAAAPSGIILSGGPASVYQASAPKCDPAIFDLGIPVLGICYGLQLMVEPLGGDVAHGDAREYGKAIVSTTAASPLFEDLPAQTQMWMSHGDKVTRLPEGFATCAKTDNTEFAAVQDLDRRLFGIQFHPEVVHTEHGKQIISNFVFNICRSNADWQLTTWIEDTVEKMKRQVGDDEVVLGLSGGVDSSVAAVLLHKAIGPRLHCIFVDNGLLRYREAEQVEEMFAKNLGLDLTVARAAQKFYAALKGLDEPEAKRKAIGKTFIDVFADEARKFKHCRFLGQGTIYPDVIESSHAVKGPSQTIKSHHNVGGLPPDLKFELVEPLRDLFKDEVRAVGRVLGMADELLDRQPFPGPGLGVRILGEVTEEKVKLLQLADVRVQEEVKKLPNYKSIWQTFAVLLPVKSVGVMGDQRTYEYTCAIRSVDSIDAMTADWTRLPYETLGVISNRIINEVRGINRVVYDISSKPPATIEWE
jgi:GMP synthase (glutamine-hydrolysing)